MSKKDSDIEEIKYILYKEIKNKNPSYNSLINRENQKDKYSDNIKNIENLYGLDKQILKEIKGLDNREKSFKKKLNEKKDSSFTYPSTLKKSLNNYLNEYENSVNTFKEYLNTYHNKIKKRIQNILEEEFDEFEIVIKEKIDYLISNQNKLEEEILKNKNKDIENAKNEELIKLRKEEISSEMSDLKNLINKIIESKKSFDNRIIECNNLNQLIDQKEKKYYFISLQIKDKIEKIKDLEKYRKNLNMLINSLNEQISKLNKIIDSFNILENQNQNRFNYNSNDKSNYLNDKKYNGRKDKINKLKKNINNELNNISNINNENNYFSNMKNHIEQLTMDSDLSNFILYDYFYNENIIEEDETYFKLKKEEKNILRKLYNENNNINPNKDTLLNNIEFNTIPNIKSNIINQIFKNEKIDTFCRNKLINELEFISNNEKEFKIDKLTILLVGRKTVGKTTLVKYLLQLDDYDIKNNNNMGEFFIPYTSEKVSYLKIIEVRGIGFDENCTPKRIREEIEKYINKYKNDFYSMIHCIWYCICDTRFEEDERHLFIELKKIYNDNIMPIILFFTKSINNSLFREMQEKLIQNNIDNSFVEVVAEDILLANKKVKKAFGKEKLMNITKKKCTEALDGDMMKVMVQKISNNLKDNLMKGYKNIIQNIENETFNDFVE